MKSEHDEEQKMRELLRESLGTAPTAPENEEVLLMEAVGRLVPLRRLLWLRVGVAAGAAAMLLIVFMSREAQEKFMVEHVNEDEMALEYDEFGDSLVGEEWLALADAVSDS